MAKKIFRIIVFASFSILAWVIQPPTTQAQSGCNVVDTPGCPQARPFSCSYTDGGGITTRACCANDGTSCNAFRQSLAGGGVTQAGNRQVVNPVGECSEAIDTALGCIPYTAEAFGPALLGFLAGTVGAIALLVMLFATVQIMAAGGDAEAVKKGKELFTGAVTGLLFIIFSVTLLKIIAGDIIQLPGFSLVPRAYAQNIDYGAYNQSLGYSMSDSVGGIIGEFLPYLLIIAGLILFAMLVFGGFTMLSGAASKDGMEKGKHMITSALTGFFVIFLAYWIAQLVQVIFGISIVS